MTITAQDEYQAEVIAQRSGRPTQNELVLAALLKADGRWVSMPDLGRAMGGWAVHSRIADLRKGGWCIPPPFRAWVDGVCCTSYRLLASPWYQLSELRPSDPDAEAKVYEILDGSTILPARWRSGLQAFEDFNLRLHLVADGELSWRHHWRDAGPPPK
jgi:hypothetical protein